MHAKSVFHLPFAFQAHEALVDIGSHVGMYVHVVSSQKMAFLQYEFYDAQKQFIDMKEEIETK